MTSEIPDATDPTEIVAIAWGGIDASIGCVLMELWVRSRNAAGARMIGTRAPVLVHYEVLKGLSNFESELLALFETRGAKNDALPPVAAPLPGWDDGPELSSPKAYQHFCEGLGYVDVDAKLGALRLWFETRAVSLIDRNRKEDIYGAEYLIAHRALADYHDGLRKVLRRMESMGIGVATKPH